MCWSAEASAVIGTAGAAAAVYGESRGVSRGFTIPLVFFSIMEFLQFASYQVIGTCALPGNSALTEASYAHIALQPIFMNMFLLAFLSASRRLEIRKYVYGAAGFASLLLFLKAFPLYPASLCKIGETLCGPSMCTFHGSWHLAWSVPLYNFPLVGDAFLYYGIAVFILPLFYAPWDAVAKNFLLGPVAAYALAGGNPNEWPAIWCLYSVLIILTILATYFENQFPTQKVKDLIFAKKALSYRQM